MQKKVNILNLELMIYICTLDFYETEAQNKTFESLNFSALGIILYSVDFTRFRRNNFGSASSECSL